MKVSPLSPLCDNASFVTPTGIAFVPGRYGYLGGTGLFVGENSTLEQQSHAWHLAEYMMQNASLYAMLQGSPPPFEVLAQLTASIFSRPFFSRQDIACVLVLVGLQAPVLCLAMSNLAKGLQYLPASYAF